LKFFFDNNLPRRLAHALRELSEGEPGVEEVRHLRDLFAADAADVEWITKLATDGPWYIISIDRFRQHHDAEREALRRFGHTVFVLDSQWSRHTYWLQCERLVRWWPTLLQSAALMSGGAFRVPWAYTNKAKLAAIKL
jgi:hypothetical protein